MPIEAFSEVWNDFNGEHYWEIGKAGYPLERIINDIHKQGLQLQKTYRVYENPYHRLFVLRKMGVNAYESLHKH